MLTKICTFCHPILAFPETGDPFCRRVEQCTQ